MPQPDNRIITDKNNPLTLLDYFLQGIIINIKREDVEPKGYSKKHDEN